MHQALGSGYHAAWLPTTPHELGAYGRMEEDVLRVSGNLRDLGVHYEVDLDTIPDKLELSSCKGVAITTKAKGEINTGLPHIPEAAIGLGIEFQSEGSFIISSEEVFEDRIKNPGSLETQIRELRDQGKWDSCFRIVTGILRMPVATILISQSNNTKLELSFEGTLIPSVKELGNARVSTRFLWESSVMMKIAPARNAVPIIQLHKLVRGFQNYPPRLRTYGMAQIESPGAEETWSLVLDNSDSGELE